MSTGLECIVAEIPGGAWVDILEDKATRNHWDWCESSTAYGPFPSYEAACAHLRDNHANPGGHMIEHHTEETVAANPVLKSLLDDLTPVRSRIPGPWRV